MSAAAAVMTVGSNMKHVGMVIGGCNLVGFIASAAFETHKITDLVGVGSFVAAAISLSLRNPAIFTRMKVTDALGKGEGALGKLMIGLFHYLFYCYIYYYYSYYSYFSHLLLLQLS